MKDYVISRMRDSYKARGFKVLGITKGDSDIHFYLKDVRKTKEECPQCEAVVENSYESRLRTYRDSPSADGRNVYLHILRREMTCPKCHKHFTAAHPLLKSRYGTKDFLGIVKFFTKNPELSNKDIADEFGVSEHFVRNHR